MIRYSDEASSEEIDKFVKSLPETFFSHKDVMRCYSIFERNEYHRAARCLPVNTKATEPASTPPKPRKQRRVWTDQEIEALKQGVSRFGKKNFSAILKAYPSIFGPSGRTCSQLEKKWSQLTSKGTTKPSGTLDSSFVIPPADD